MNRYLYFVLSKTVDSVKGALLLATQTPVFLCYSTPSNVRRICALKYCNRYSNKLV